MGTTHLDIRLLTLRSRNWLGLDAFRECNTCSSLESGIYRVVAPHLLSTSKRSCGHSFCIGYNPRSSLGSNFGSLLSYKTDSSLDFNPHATLGSSVDTALGYRIELDDAMWH
ncbi:hypothetical protein EVAR_9083_1 [Eumeta japonica]|uniref:Uncharacterized protein n=1 Tax=Eumeta variegata TaxID=151549 RepID=A0A4C1TW33_EUMVA|nr:hypothetical protein EVAR_9083_1 [Eumeta japonica]